MAQTPKDPLRLPNDWFMAGLIFALVPFFLCGFLALVELYCAHAARNPRWWAVDVFSELCGCGASAAVAAVLLWLRLRSSIIWVDMEESSASGTILPHSERYRPARAKTPSTAGSVGLGLAALAALALKICLTQSESVPIPGGAGSGLALGGRFFGVFHLFGQDWTGMELCVIVPLLGGLVFMAWRGLSQARALNFRERTRWEPQGPHD
jgi:hypothetical protein